MDDREIRLECFKLAKGQTSFWPGQDAGEVNRTIIQLACVLSDFVLDNEAGPVSPKSLGYPKRYLIPYIDREGKCLTWSQAKKEIKGLDNK